MSGNQLHNRQSNAAILALALAVALACISLPGCDDDTTSPEIPTTYQDTTSYQILLIGNSLSLWHSAHGILQALADTSGLDLYLQRALYSGRGLAEICEQTDVFTQIKDRHWDYVIIQGSDYEIGFPDLRHVAKQPIQQLADSVQINDPQTHIVLYLDYALPEGITVDDVTYSETTYQQMIRDGTLEIAGELGLTVAPVGVAWGKVRAEQPDVEMFAWDGYHPSGSGAYLMGCIYYSTIFKYSTQGIEVNGELSTAQADYLQQIASTTVLDSLTVWGPENKCR